MRPSDKAAVTRAINRLVDAAKEHAFIGTLAGVGNSREEDEMLEEARSSIENEFVAAQDRMRELCERLADHG